MHTQATGSHAILPRSWGRPTLELAPYSGDVYTRWLSGRPGCCRYDTGWDRDGVEVVMSAFLTSPPPERTPPGLERSIEGGWTQWNKTYSNGGGGAAA